MVLLARFARIFSILAYLHLNLHELVDVLRKFHPIFTVFDLTGNELGEELEKIFIQNSLPL